MGTYSAYTNLIGEIAKSNITNGEIAQKLHIHPNTLRNKIKGESAFTVEEAFELRRLFFPKVPIDFLFSRENQKMHKTLFEEQVEDMNVTL